MQALSYANYLISIIFAVFYIYQIVYIPIVLIFRKKKDAKIAAERGETVLHDYAVLICARNEEVVIGDLLSSIKSQTYPADRIRVFVCADNCTDGTAEKARENGAEVFERFDKENVGKGYALDYMLKRISEKYPDAFDGFIVFDADNIVAKDYIERMNESFCDGNDIITSYRNSKNYGCNWISAGIGLWFIRESVYLNNARYVLGISCAVSGTGFLFSKKILKEDGGWPYHLLTEDIEFSADHIVRGDKIAFCSDAMIFDEQPVKFRQSLSQQVRWCKGYLQLLRKYGWDLIKTFVTKASFSSYDMLMNIAPAYLLSIASIICNVTLFTIGLIQGNDPMIALMSIGQLLFNAFLLFYAVGLITTITEWKKIRTTAFKKILFTFTFPVYMATFVPLTFVALFAKISWKPIKHTMSVEKMSAEGQDTDFT